MTTFEYKTIHCHIGDLSRDPGDLKNATKPSWVEEKLNNMGKEGWELISIIPKVHHSSDAVLYLKKAVVTN